jgi:hypothetical protein
MSDATVVAWTRTTIIRSDGSHLDAGEAPVAWVDGTPSNDRRIYAHIAEADSSLRVGEELTAEERCYDPTGKEIDCWRFTLRLDGIRRLADGRTELRCTICGRDALD